MPDLRPLRLAAVVVLALLSLAACDRQQEAKIDVAAREAQLKQELGRMRDAIRKFRAENGRHPHTLEELVPRFLPAVPVDPMTGSATTWRTTTEETVEENTDFSGTTPAEKPRPVIVDVQSGAGAPYSNY